MNKQLSNPSTLLNSKYEKLCQQLGDSILKLEQLQSHIDTIRSEIISLNKSFPLLNEYINSQSSND